MTEHEEELLNAETERRWEEEVMQGKVVSHERVVEWLRSWGTNNQIARPRPIYDKKTHLDGQWTC